MILGVFSWKKYYENPTCADAKFQPLPTGHYYLSASHQSVCFLKCDKEFYVKITDIHLSLSHVTYNRRYQLVS
jgi:hypothetical protein